MQFTANSGIINKTFNFFPRRMSLLQKKEIQHLKFKISLVEWYLHLDICWFTTELMKECCDNQRIVVQHGEVTIQSNEKSFTYHINSDIGKAYFKILFICTRSLIYLDVIYFITFVILCRISENLTERKLRQFLFLSLFTKRNLFTKQRY